MTTGGVDEQDHPISHRLHAAAHISHYPDAAGQDTEIDFVSAFLRDSSLAQGLDVSRMPASQRAALNRLLNSVYQLGTKRARDGLAAASPGAPSSGLGPAAGVTARAYETRVDSDDGDVLTLENGGIVEIMAGYPGYLGYRKREVLLTGASGCRIAISGKRTFRCAVLRNPNYGRARSAEIVGLSRVRADGAILELVDGRMLEVDVLGKYSSSLWLPGSNLVILDGIEAINLDDVGDPIMITRIR